MYRELTSHKVTPCNEQLTVSVLGEPGPGGASAHYGIHGFTRRNAEDTDDETSVSLHFQDGPIPTHGVNGITNEALIAIVIDRLQAYQAGPFGCRENAIALTHLEDSMHWLHHRTRARVARGVEGSLTK